MAQANKTPIDREDSMTDAVDAGGPDNDVEAPVNHSPDAEPEPASAAEDPEANGDTDSQLQLSNTAAHDCNHQFKMSELSDRPHRCSLRTLGVCAGLRGDRMDPKKDKRLKLVLQCVGTKAAPGCSRLMCRACHQLSAPRHKDDGSKGRKLRAQAQLVEER